MLPVKFNKIVTIEQKQCEKCYLYSYTVPCLIDKEIANFFNNINNDKSYYKNIQVFKLTLENNIKIFGRYKKSEITFSFPKDMDLNQLNSQKDTLENNLINWLIQKTGLIIEK